MIQVDIKMPKYCIECYFLHDGEDQRGKTYEQLHDKPRCVLTGREEVSGVSIRVSQRPDDCPLVEV